MKRTRDRETGPAHVSDFGQDQGSRCKGRCAGRFSVLSLTTFDRLRAWPRRAGLCRRQGRVGRRPSCRASEVRSERVPKAPRGASTRVPGAVCSSYVRYGPHCHCHGDGLTGCVCHVISCVRLSPGHERMSAARVRVALAPKPNWYALYSFLWCICTLSVYKYWAQGRPLMGAAWAAALAAPELWAF